MHPIFFCVSQQKTISEHGNENQTLNYLYKIKKMLFFINHLKGFTYCFPVNVCMSLHIIKKRKLILIMLQHRLRPNWQLKLDLLTGNLKTKRVDFLSLSLSTAIVLVPLYLKTREIMKFVPTKVYVCLCRICRCHML